jgi:hypothetical protein
MNIVYLVKFIGLFNELLAIVKKHAPALPEEVAARVAQIEKEAHE